MDVSDIFYFFSVREGEWESEAPGGGGGGTGFSLKIPGGGFAGEGGAEGPGGYLQRTGEFWGWAKYSFSGPKRPPS